MRIATWNVNSLKARQEAVENWLARAAPDILLMQETKLTDADAPVMSFAMAGYQLVHHGEGRWNGVAIAARDGMAVSDVVTNFGDGPVRDSGPGGAGAEVTGEDDFDPFDEARMVAATVDGLRVVSLYAPNGRVVGSPFYDGKLAWFERLARWIGEQGDASDLVLGGDLNVAPTDADVWDAAAVHGGTHVSEPERAAFRALLDLAAWSTAIGPSTPRLAGSRGGTTAPGCSTRTSGCASTTCCSDPAVAPRVVDAEIDRDARKGPARPVRSRPAAGRPRRARPPDRPRLGGRPGTDQGPHQARPLAGRVALRGPCRRCRRRSEPSIAAPGDPFGSGQESQS